LVKQIGARGSSAREPAPSSIRSATAKIVRDVLFIRCLTTKAEPRTNCGRVDANAQVEFRSYGSMGRCPRLGWGAPLALKMGVYADAGRVFYF
jgi:hypothetical protein